MRRRPRLPSDVRSPPGRGTPVGSARGQQRRIRRPLRPARVRADDRRPGGADAGDRGVDARRRARVPRAAPRRRGRCPHGVALPRGPGDLPRRVPAGPPPRVRRRDVAGRHVHVVPQAAQLGRRRLDRHAGDLRRDRPTHRASARDPPPDDDPRPRARRRRGVRRRLAHRVRGHHLPPVRVRLRDPRARRPRPPRARAPPARPDDRHRRRRHAGVARGRRRPRRLRPVRRPHPGVHGAQRRHVADRVRAA